MHPAIEALRIKSSARAPIYLRAINAWSDAQRLLHQAGITNRAIADESGVPLATVSRALSLRFCGKTSHGPVIAVRSAAERLLPALTTAHWDEYDNNQKGMNDV